MVMSVELTRILEKANQYIEQEEYGKAKVLLELVQEVFPEQFDCLFAMGRIALNIHAPQIALEFFVRAEKAFLAYSNQESLKSIYATLLANMGLAYARCDQLTESIITWKKCLKIQSMPLVVQWYQELFQKINQKGSAFDEWVEAESVRYSVKKNKVNTLTALLQQKSPHRKQKKKVELVTQAEWEKLNALVFTQKTPEAYHEAIQLGKNMIPKLPEANPFLFHILAIAYYQVGDLESALTFLHQAVTIQPNNAFLYNTFGVIQKKKMAPEQVVEIFKHALVYKPNYAEACMNLANTLRDNNQYEEAILWYEWTFELNPNYYEAFNNLGLVYKKSLEYTKALEQFQRALDVKPDYALPHINMGAVYEEQRKRKEAITHYTRALALNPHLKEAYLPLVYNQMTLCDWEHLEERIQIICDCIDADLDMELIPFSLIAIPHVTPQQIRHATEIYVRNQYKKYLLRRNELHFDFFNRPRKAKIRVGFVSPDLRDHPVATYLEPLFKYYDKDQFEFFAYYCFKQGDSITQRLSQQVDCFRVVADMPWKQIVELIYQDQIDILVDPSGLTSFSYLHVFAGKPAPVQVTWLGYPATTGLETMDYILTDPYTCPPGEMESYYVEKVWRLPDVFCVYHPCTRQPERRNTPELAVHPTPALENGYITFGCFNGLYKLNQEVFALWAEILKAVPTSKLLLESAHLDETEAQSNIQHHFETLGIAPNRLVFYNRIPAQQYVLYHKIDIALDPFPCNGGTTTSDTLWMGVPLITLDKSGIIASRMGVSLLTTIGHPEWIAKTKAEYIKKAVDLASDVQRLNQIRLNLRQEVESSPFMDDQRFMRNLEQAFKGMLENWYRDNAFTSM